jgi:hypothetical protein
MKTIFLKLSVLALFLSLTSCDKDDAPKVEEASILEIKTFNNLYAPQTGGQGQPVGGEFTKFSFSKNAIVTSDSWDIAFRGTTILVNGGTEIGITNEPLKTGIASVSIVNDVFENIINFPNDSSFLQDGVNTYAIATGSNNGWYNYNPTTNLVLPLAGKVFVVKTHDGNYAKFEILSYYQDAPSNPDQNSVGRYFTFKFVYQSESETNF